MKEQQQGDVLLVLHGNRQTGQLLLGRIDRLVKRLKKEFGIEAIAPDAPYPADDDENGELRTWWNRGGNNYLGLEDSLALVQEETTNQRVVGILGFSQGARFAHLLASLHHRHPETWFPALRFAIFVAGYDGPTPPEFLPYCDSDDSELSLSSLHIWGSNDALVTPLESERLAALYCNKETYVHPGKHHVPTKGSELSVYIDFLQKAFVSTPTAMHETPSEQNPIPDEETAAMQREEIQALEAIYPDAIDLRSRRNYEDVFDFPIVYHIKLNDMEMDNDEDFESGTTNWPKHPLTIEINYPVNYPSDDLDTHKEESTVPLFKLLHENTVFEFPSEVSAKLVSIFEETARNVRGMPCVLSCLYSAREYLDAKRDWSELSLAAAASSHKIVGNDEQEEVDGMDESQQEYESNRKRHAFIRASSAADIRRGNLEGLEIAEALLRQSQQNETTSTATSNSDDAGNGGGSFGTYTIGLVGKPSAGKSTFFNAATAFSRQRGQYHDVATGDIGENGANSSENDDLGGASMAAHPFTTIDPNVGYCLVPAPRGSCPEDDDDAEGIDTYGSTHGRDANGRRFVPVLLKDVAGLVPGAYQGKGRGNQFLNDLTDATVLIHVVDSSGSADSSGNKIIIDDHAETKSATSGDNEQQHTNPMDDLAWIRAELVEWVYSNLATKWVAISRKGRSKLAGMFSGYGQKPEMVESAFSALEKFLEGRYQRDRALDRICDWDECDVHRLVSLFLGVRFPMALCLNKYDLPSARNFVKDIKESLPVHGAHVGTPMSAKKEMTFVKEQMILAKNMNEKSSFSARTADPSTPPLGVWECLTSAINLREPILVFPVSDITTFAPMSSLDKVATGDPSLPSKGMIRCIQAAGGSAPSNWNTEDENYFVPTKKDGKNVDSGVKLRDVILMKPGSTVEDVFFTLKRSGALGGEFVRAEASSGTPGERPKPVPKHERISRKNRVIKIMTNKRTQWQGSATVKKERNRYQSNR